MTASNPQHEPNGVLCFDAPIGTDQVTAFVCESSLRALSPTPKTAWLSLRAPRLGQLRESLARGRVQLCELSVQQQMLRSRRPPRANASDWQSGALASQSARDWARSPPRKQRGLSFGAALPPSGPL